MEGIEGSGLVPAPLVLRLFGPFEAWVGGEPLGRLRSRKGGWLLALLALRPGREVDRGWLAETLWPESDPSVARGNLITYLKDLRRALGPEAGRLESPTKVTLRLELAGAEVDVLAFDEAIARGNDVSLERAVARYRGPLLEGCGEEWVAEERAVREQAFLQALERLAREAMFREDFAAAEGYLRRTVAADPLREAAQRALMQSLASRGEYAAATQVYRDLRHLLYRELNAEPAPETMALYQQIRDGARRWAREGGSEGGREGASEELAEKRLSSSRCPFPRSLAPSLPPSLPPSHISRSLTQLVGREEEVTQIRQYLAASRLVTLTGPPGVGKTRLATRVAEEVGEGSAEGAWFVDLAPLDEGAPVARAIAVTLGIRDEPGRPLIETLVAFLEARSLLLVLDNCEHVLAGAAEAAQLLLERADGLTVLATSRRPLHLPVEQVFPVAPLPTPREGQGSRVKGQGSTIHAVQPSIAQRAPDPQPSPEHLMQFPSVQLFVERARAARPDFRVTAANARAVAAICRRLEGLPLALELAAARARVLTPEQMLERLNRRFELLVGPRRSDPRHRSLRAALDWSHQLLTPEAQRFFASLSVFRGGWTLEAAEAVCARGASVECEVFSVRNEASASTLNAQHLTLPLEEGQVLDLLTELMDGSLVAAAERRGEMRFRLLETLREYAAEQLPTAERETVGRRHAAYYLSLAERGATDRGHAEEAAWLDQLETEYGNLRSALQWALDASASRVGPRELETGLRLCEALQRFWWVRGYMAEGRERLQELLELLDGRSQRGARIRVLSAAARLAAAQGEYIAARVLAREGVAIARDLGDTSTLATSLYELAGVIGEHLRSGHGSFDDDRNARALFEESLALRREWRDRSGIAYTLLGMGKLAAIMGDSEQARVCFEESLALYRALGDRHEAAMTLDQLASLARGRGDYEQARPFLEESLAIKRKLGNPLGIANSLRILGDVMNAQGDGVAARARYEESLALHRELGHQRGIATLLRFIAELELRGDNPERGWELLDECLRIQREVEDPCVTGRWLHIMGGLAVERGEYRTAAALFQKSLAINREAGDQPGVSDVLHSLGLIAQEQGDYGTASSLYQESLTIRRDLHDRKRIASALHRLGELSREQGEYERAQTLQKESLAIRREAGDQRGAAYVLHSLGLIAEARGEIGRARVLFGESLGIRRALGSRTELALSLWGLGVVAMAEGLGEAARSHFEESLAIRREIGDQRGIAISLSGLGSMAWARGDCTAARTLQEESLAIAQALGDKRGIASALHALGDVDRAEGDPEAARKRYQESLTIRHEMGNRRGAAETLEGLAAVAAATGNMVHAAQLLGAAATVRQAIGAPLSLAARAPYEGLVADVRAAQSEASFSAAWTEGREMAFEQAMRYTLSDGS